MFPSIIEPNVVTGLGQTITYVAKIDANRGAAGMLNALRDTNGGTSQWRHVPGGGVPVTTACPEGR